MTEAWITAIWPDGLGPQKEIVCRHCGARNRVYTARAVVASHKYDCARCEKPLFLRPDEPFARLDSRNFEHPLDASALRTLRAFPGVSTIVKLFYKHFNERAFLFNLSASAVRCGDDQCPELVKLVELAKQRLGFGAELGIFLSASPFINAFTSGGDRAILGFASATVAELNDDQLVYIAGHEIGHLMSEHVIYRLIALLILNGGLFSLPGIARYLSMPLRMALYKWLRCSELTSDRAGLLACRDLHSVLTTYLDLTGGSSQSLKARGSLSLPAFIRQARALSDLNSENAFDGIVASFFNQDSTHPMNAWRLLELIQWVEDGNYLDILAGDYFYTE